MQIARKSKQICFVRNRNVKAKETKILEKRVSFIGIKPNKNGHFLGSRPHLERLLGSTVLRLLDSGILTDLNDKIDFENGWVSNEAWNGENQSNFARVFSQNCDLGECITIEDKNGLMVSPILHFKLHF
jgi:hypothetical protein